MRICSSLLFLLGCSAAFAGSLPSSSSVEGNYIEARTADVYTGPCFANGEVGAVGDLAVFGWNVTKGSWNGVSLDGLSVVGAVKASATLGDVHSNPYPAKAVLIVDERATAMQRLALQSMAKQLGGELLSDIVRIEYQPIALTIDGSIHATKATLTAGTIARIQTRALGERDQICHNESVWYLPLTKVDHAMPAFAVAHSFKGEGLGTVWSNPDKRSAFVGTFHYQM